MNRFAKYCHIYCICLFVGCSSPIEQYTDAKTSNSQILKFLKEGETARETVLSKLGEPYSNYDEYNISIYLLDYSDPENISISKSKDIYGFKKEVFSTQESYEKITDIYQLVLVFDENGYLSRKSIVGRQ